MGTIGNLIVNIGAKIDDLRKGLSDSTSLINGAKGSFESLGGVMGTALQAGEAIAVGALVRVGAAALTLGPQLIGLGSDAAEMQGKFDIVFGENAPAAAQELEEFSDTVGRNRYELMGWAAGLQDTFVPLGFARDQAAEMSVQLTELAVDLSSFNNVAEADVINDLQTAMVGNTEVMKKYGVVINADAIEQEALRAGLLGTVVDQGKVQSATDALALAQQKLTELKAKDNVTTSQMMSAEMAVEKAQLALNTAMQGSVGELTEQAKAQAILNLIMAGTADAQGDATRTADGWANQMRALQATLTETGTEIGLKLLPVLTPLLASLGDLAEKYLPVVVDWVAQWLPLLQETGTTIAQQALPWLLAMGDWLLNVGWPAVQQFGEVLLSQLIPDLMQLWTWAEELGEAALPLLGAAVQFVTDNFDIIGPVLGVVAGLVLALTSPVTAVTALVLLLATAWANDWGGIQEKTQAVLDFLQPYWDDLTAVLNRFIAELLPPLQEAWLELQAVWRDSIGPALADLWAALQDLFKELGFGTGETDAWGIVLDILKGFLDRVVFAVELLTPAIRLVGEALEFSLGMTESMVEGLESMLDAVEFLLSPLGDLADAIGDMVDEALDMPDWLVPHSPTAFELGLRGIGKAIKDLPELRLDVANGNTAGPGGGAAGGGQVSIGNLNLYGVQDAKRLFEEIQREARARGVNFAPVG